MSGLIPTKACHFNHIIDFGLLGMDLHNADDITCEYD
jgi:hypothetical protein